MNVETKEDIKVLCDYCGSNDNDFLAYRRSDSFVTSIVSREYFFGIYKCNGCHLYFVFPKPSPKELKNFFTEEYHSVRYVKPLHSVLEEYPERRIGGAAITRLRRFIKRILLKVSRSNDIVIEDIIKKHIGHRGRKASVLEIGPGTAPLLYLGNLGYRYMGIEPAREVVDIFNRKGHLNIRCGFGEDLNFIGEGVINAVIFVGTLSHVADVNKVFSECVRILTHRGIILIIDNNADRDVIRNIGGGYTNYGFSRDFLAGSVDGFELTEYFYLDDQKRMVKDGSKILAVLRKR